MGGKHLPLANNFLGYRMVIASKVPNRTIRLNQRFRQVSWEGNVGLGS
jgi:hypothetical protein